MLKFSATVVQIFPHLFFRRRYEKGHWDSVIQNYREVELFDEEIDNLNLFLQPIRQFIEERHDTSCSTDPSLHFSGTWLPCHAIDLHKDGELNAHVDSVRFSGNLVAGLSLLSDAIMRLKPSSDSSSNDASQEKGDSSNEYIDLFLPRRSLYVLSGMSRYEYTHELLPSGSRFQDKSPVQRDRRLSIIFRDTKLQHCC
jgi:alkylated DNA repair protein alkB family protein 7